MLSFVRSAGPQRGHHLTNDKKGAPSAPHHAPSPPPAPPLPAIPLTSSPYSSPISASHPVPPHPPAPRLAMTDRGQVQLRLPVQPASSPTPHTPPCRSTASHLSLRRFAHNCAFGAASRLGPESTDPAFSSLLTEPPATSLLTSGNATTFAQLAASAHTAQDTDAAVSSSFTQAGNASPNRRPRSGNFPSSAASRLSSSSAASFAREHVSSAPSSPSPSSNMFSSLPMQKRPTHAHSAPTRAGEEISVDALTRKFERLLGTDTPSWKSRGICKNARPAGAKKGLRTNKALVAAFGELFVERVNDADGNEIVHESNERAEAVEKLQDHDTDDELSFLINKFELDGESKQSVFMPYIT